MLGTRGEVEGSSSVCARGVCVDPAGCLSPTVHATPALACGRALPPGEVEPDTAQASWLAAALSSVAGAGEVSGGHTMPLPHVRAAFLPEREGHDPKVGICPLMLPRVLSTQTQKSGLGSVNSQPKSAQCLGPSPKPMDSHCPMPWPRRGSRQSARAQRAGRMEPWSIRREWYTAQTPTLSANVRRGFSPLEHCQSAWLQLFLRPDSRDLGLGTRNRLALRRRGGSVPQQGRNAGLERPQFWV